MITTREGVRYKGVILLGGRAIGVSVIVLSCFEMALGDRQYPFPGLLAMVEMA